jgi:hypothetical protein
MHHRFTIIGILLSTLQGSPVLAGKIYRWFDKQGQIHFGDIAPTNAKSPISIRQPDTSGKSDAGGLRRTEIELLTHIEQRTRQQALQARNRMLKNTRKRAEQREHCDRTREKLHGSTGEKTYKQYSRYLRKHCW